MKRLLLLLALTLLCLCALCACDGEDAGHTHEWSEWSVTTPATCQAVGEETRSCTCGESETRSLNKLAHTYDQEVVNDTYLKSAATEQAAAYYYYSCTCGAKGSEDFAYGEPLVRTVSVKVYVDGALSQTLTTDNEKGYKITPPEKPTDITTNPNSEKYFYGWFVDANLQTPLTEVTVFEDGGAIYAKWINVYSNQFTYTVNYGKATITGFQNTTATVVVIPCYINSFPVETIAMGAFVNKTMLRTVIVCDGIKVIESGAFNNCNSMQTIMLPNSLTSIAADSIINAPLLEYTQAGNVNYIGNYQNPYLVAVAPTDSSATEITLKRECNFCFVDAFAALSNLASVTVEADNQVYFSQSGILYNAAKTEILLVPRNLQGAVVIPSGITAIASNQFAGRSGMTSIALPLGVVSVGNGAFSGCTGLQKVVISDIAAWCNISFGSSDTNPLYYAKHLYLGENEITNLVIPSSVTSIGSYAFYYCTGLTSITIPSSVTSIGSSAFSGCTGLKTVTFAEGSKLTSIGYQAFYGCTSLESVTFAEGSKLTSIGYQAFYNCTGLVSITIPSSVTSIGQSAFGGCTGLESMTLPFIGASLSGWSNTHFGYIFGASSYSSNSSYVPTSLKTVVITGGSSIYSRAFYNCTGLTSITIPSSVTSIGSYAFYNCTGLASITIPSSVTYIGSSAFEDCTGLKNVTFENTTGWWRAGSSTATSGTSIASADLANTSTAATYLTSTYKSCYWKRG